MKNDLFKLLQSILAWGTATTAAFALQFDGGTNVLFSGTNVVDTTLYVGRYDNENRFVITNGASVTVENAFIGQNSDHNTLLITDSGSLLQIKESLEVGPNNAQNNRLVLENGAQVNIGTVSGTDGAISIGGTNDNVRLTLGNRAMVKAEFLYVSTASNENGTVTLNDEGTRLIISDTAYIGRHGSSNSLHVNRGSSLAVSNLLQIGSNSTSNNILNVRGTTIVSRVEIHNPDSNKINIQNGGRLTYLGDVDLYNAAEKGFDFASGSELEVGGELLFSNKVDSGLSIILNGGLDTNLAVRWNTQTDEMYIGETTGRNRLIVKNGASAVAGGRAAHIGEYSSDNSVSVEGSNSIFSVTGQLIHGLEGDRNRLDVMDGGTVEIGADLRVGLQSAAQNNEVNVSNATLTVRGSATIGGKGTSNELTIEGNGLLDVTGSLYIGKTGRDNTVTFSGSNTMANVGGDLFVGNMNRGNRLLVESGATNLVMGDAYIGTNGASNRIGVRNTNSYLHIAGSVTMGNSETNENTGNILFSLDTAQIDIGGDLNIFNESIIQVEADSQITVAGDYYQDASSEYRFSISTNGFEKTNLVVAGTALYASNTTFRVVDGGIPTNQIFEQVVVAADMLYFGETNTPATTEMLNNTNLVNFMNLLLRIDGIVTNHAIQLTTEALSIAEGTGLAGTPLEPLANEIDSLARSGNVNARSMRTILDLDMDTSAEANQAMRDFYDEKESSVPANNIINMGIQHVAEQLTMRTDSTRSRQGNADSDNLHTNNPQETEADPEQIEHKLQGWLNFFGSKGSQDAADEFRGYDVNMNGFMIGVDTTIGDNIFFGIASGSGNSSADKERASIDAKTTYGTLYASADIKSWKADASFIYGVSSVDADLGSAFDTEVEYDAKNYAFYLGGGKELIGDYLIFTPRFSLLGNYYTQEEYEEKSSNAVGRKVDSFDAFYLQSSLGASLGGYMGAGSLVLKPELRLFWLHEWLGEEERLNYQLIGGSQNHNLFLQSPEKDIFKIGIGSSVKAGEYLEFRADLDTRISRNYNDYTFLGSVRYRF